MGLGDLIGRYQSGSAIAYYVFVCCGRKRKRLRALEVILNNKHIAQMFLHDSTPGQQNSLILLQLFHEGRVWFGDSSSFFHIVKGSVQVPAVLLHSISNHCGGRAAHTHLAVDQTLSTGFPMENRRTEETENMFQSESQIEKEGKL